MDLKSVRCRLNGKNIICLDSLTNNTNKKNNIKEQNINFFKPPSCDVVGFVGYLAKHSHLCIDIGEFSPIKLTS